METITVILRSGMGMQLASVRPYLKPGTPIAIGRGGAVIAEVSEGNAIEDKRKAAESAADHLGLADRVNEFNRLHTGILEPGIFDIITGTAGQSAPQKQQLPSPENHASQIERVAADLREHGPDREELKPCAFCGGPPVPFVQLASQGFGSAPRMDSYGDDGLSVEAFVFCHECGAHGPMFAEDIFDASDYDQAMAEGVRLWQDRDGRHADLYEANANLNLFPRWDSMEEGGGA